LRNFVVNLSKLGMSFHPGAAREARANAQAAAAHVLGMSAKEVLANVKKSAKLAKADVRDAGFRPGNFQQPETLAPDEALDGGVIVEMAAMQLARTFGDVAQTAKSARISTPRVSIQTKQADLAVCATFPQSYRSHYLPAFTAAQLAALPNKRRSLVIIPTGAIEQHGPHLPVGVDAILGQAWLAHTLPKFSPLAAKRVFVAPPITFGKSNEHDGFAGTITISAKTLRRVLLALAAELRAMGFGTIAVLNTHGGNSPVIVYTLREIQTTLGLRAGMIKPDFSGRDARETKYGIHAGEWETALMLACAPELVRMDKALSEYPSTLEKLEKTGAAATLAWMTSDISKSGVMGDARAATAERGKFFLQKASATLAGRIAELLE